MKTCSFIDNKVVKALLLAQNKTSSRATWTLITVNKHVLQIEQMEMKKKEDKEKANQQPSFSPAAASSNLDAE